jgi:O-succinylbenzoic acid--CoA ligase
VVSFVGTMLQRVLEARVASAFPSALRCVLLGGGPASVELLRGCEERGVPVMQTYGLTEAASQVATLAPHDARRKLGSAGKPLMGVELEIRRVGRGREQMEAGQVGEIVIRGATVIKDYVDDADATARAFRDGWFHTGDLGYLDDEGFLYVVARREDLIVSGGENIYPAEIETVLQAHPAILEAAVVGVPHPRWMQTPIAFLVRRPNQHVDAQELERHCAKQLAGYKLPTRFIFVESLPRNASGKLLRTVLRARAESEYARENETERE